MTDRTPMASSYPEATLDAARQMLVDFIHHKPADCDKAARRLRGSHRHEDRTLGQEWLKVRAMEVG